MDILNFFDTIKVCTRYKNEKLISNDYSEFMNDLDSVEPVYENVPGWQSDINDIKVFSDLPENAKSYINYLETL